MKKIFFSQLFVLLVISSFAQPNYSSTGGIETPYKDKYKLTAKLDEKTNTLSFETNAPVTVVTLETYTAEELAVRKGKEYTNTYTKVGNKYLYDLKKTLLKDKYAYWVKVSIGKNGAPLGEYYFQRTKEAIAIVSEQKEKKDSEPSEEETTNDASHPVIKTSIRCEAGKVKVTKALKELDGVFVVKIDIKTGILKLHYSSDGTPLNDIIDAILDNGFDVLDDGQASGLKKSTKPSANPCKKNIKD